MKIKQDQMIHILRLAKFIIIIFFIILIFGYIITQLEPRTFPTLLDGIWWSLTTISTVGYGDFAPSTTAGKLIGMLLIFVGGGFIVTYFAAVTTAAISTEEAFMKGTQSFSGTNHLIIVGWNERSKNIIETLQAKKSKLPIVLIDHTLKQHPTLLGNHYFIHGNATDDQILKKANIFEASKLLITANNQQDEFQADMFSILTLIACKGLNSHLFSCVEILTDIQVKNAKRAGADEIIQTNVLTSQKMTSFLNENGQPKKIH